MKRPKKKTSFLTEVYHLTKVEDFSHIKALGFFAKKGLRCVKCGCEAKYIGKTKHNRWGLYTEKFVMLNRDHIIPVSKGGNNKMENLQTMCQSCNIMKGNMNNDIFMAIPNYFLDYNFTGNPARSFKVFIILVKIIVKCYKMYQSTIKNLHSHSLI